MVKAYLLGHEVVSLLVLEELKHLDDVGVLLHKSIVTKTSKKQWRGTYNVLEDVDLVEEHTLLVLVHVALAEHLDGTLSARVSLHAHAHLAESACKNQKLVEFGEGFSK